jgi:hypothetical protein
VELEFSSFSFCYFALRRYFVQRPAQPGEVYFALALLCAVLAVFKPWMAILIFFTSLGLASRHSFQLE